MIHIFWNYYLWKVISFLSYREEYYKYSYNLKKKNIVVQKWYFWVFLTAIVFNLKLLNKLIHLFGKSSFDIWFKYMLGQLIKLFVCLKPELFHFLANFSIFVDPKIWIFMTMYINWNFLRLTLYTNWNAIPKLEHYTWQTGTAFQFLYCINWAWRNIFNYTDQTKRSCSKYFNMKLNVLI